MPTFTPARPLHRLHCAGCGWHLAILGQSEASVRKCPWCGSHEFSDQPPSRSGAGQVLQCKHHGPVVVQVLDDNIDSQDFLDNLYCPFCP
ncbi:MULTISPECIES: hypothetical protein [Pseudomonas]|uniref:hypothetical protein n=1 Tax=Pseudomonas TaxID=286 RepID=UPI0005FC5EB2|nr:MULTISPECIES: hypothetical protein [Pseudomonas]RXU65320.1 hypothetical protein CW358_13905 [Pseudomonas protegens]ULT68155.1 hypothetical protein L1O02_17210 [Pseudomonas sp. BC42]BAQ74421.1 uncharacterized protein POS17_2727 [Pseudomonas sp. Os17]BAQ80731.1 uncharacterized protein PST29_2842 [Pseudomonas sp. St29]